jgi:hypothetical protein
VEFPTRLDPFEGTVYRSGKDGPKVEGQARLNSSDGPWSKRRGMNKLGPTFLMNLFSHPSLTSLDDVATNAHVREVFSRAVCREPLAIDRGPLFSKPPLTLTPAGNQPFGRPPLPFLVRPLRAPWALDAAQLNRLFEKVIGHGCPL